MTVSLTESEYNALLERNDLLLHQLELYQEAVLAQAELIEGRWLGIQHRIDAAHAHLHVLRRKLRDMGGPYEGLRFDEDWRKEVKG